jgi:hypothetical protein
MIIGELNRNYKTIQDMFLKLKREESEDATLNQTLATLDKDMDRQVFDYIRSIIDERNCLVDTYEKNLKNQKTMIAEFNHFDINERIIDFF